MNESPLLWLRVSHELLAGGGHGELADRGLHAVGLAIGPHRGHPVVVGRVRLQTIDTHPENRFRMRAVEPDVRFRRVVNGFAGPQDARHALVADLVAFPAVPAPPPLRGGRASPKCSLEGACGRERRNAL
jgi:hypothetical protein